MSSNLLKAYRVIREQDDTRVINTNELVEKKIEKIRLVLPDMERTIRTVKKDGFSDGLDADVLEGLTEDKEQDNDSENTDILNIIKKEPSPVEPVYHGPTPDELLASAKEEIEKMKSHAIEELNDLRRNTLEEARKQGYSEGLEKAKQEELRMTKKFEEKEAFLQKQYEQEINTLEPKFVEVMTGIYEKIFEVDLSSNQDIVLTLLQNSIRKIEGCKNFLVHVSRDDFAYVNENRGGLLSESNQVGTTVDVIEDSTLNRNECMIETVNGIFDCGLNTQLGELKKKLTLLSYEGSNDQ